MELWDFDCLEIHSAQNTKTGQKLAKIGPLKSSFYLVSPPPRQRWGTKTPVHRQARQGGELNSPNLVQLDCPSVTQWDIVITFAVEVRF